jgi:hypothetical protein
VGSDGGFDEGFGRGPGRDGSERREGDERRDSDRHPGPTAQERGHRVSLPEWSSCGGRAVTCGGERALTRLALLGSWARGLGCNQEASGASHCTSLSGTGRSPVLYVCTPPRRAVCRHLPNPRAYHNWVQRPEQLSSRPLPQKAHLLLQLKVLFETDYWTLLLNLICDGS